MNRLDWRHMTVTLGNDGKVDQHNAVLFHDADQENERDYTNHGQVHMADVQREQRADTG